MIIILSSLFKRYVYKLIKDFFFHLWDVTLKHLSLRYMLKKLLQLLSLNLPSNDP